MTDLAKSSDFLAPIELQWKDTYRFLERQVAELTDELRRLQAERQTQRAEKEAMSHRLQGVLDALPGGVVVLDGSGRVQSHNPAAAALFEPPLLDEQWRDVIARCFVPDSGAGHDLCLRSGRIVTLSTCPLGSEPGQILLFQDVTHERQRQAYLNRQGRLLDMGRMAANLAHQIRTPLASALLYASQMTRPTLPGDKRQRFAEKTVASLKQLENLIANMLLFARGEVSGEERLQAPDLLREMRGWLDGQLDGKAIHCVWSCEGEGLVLRGNRTLLLSAWQNLASNALQSLGAHGRLTLFCRPAAAGSIELGVHDDGPGVTPEIQPHLFQPFSTTRSRGTGLGLSIVRAIAQAHHGEAWFRSAPGDTTFAIRLPLVQAADHSDLPSGNMPRQATA